MHATSATSILEMHDNTFSLRALMERAGMLKRLTLQTDLLRQNPYEPFCSEKLGEYVLDGGRLKLLEKHNLTLLHRPDRGCKIVSLVDENPQEHVPCHLPSNIWDFGESTAGHFDLRVQLYVYMSTRPYPHGVVLTPMVVSAWHTAHDPLPNFRLFKALVQGDEGAPSIAKALANSEGSIMVTWIEIGLPGLKKLSDVFADFKKQNESLVRLCGTRCVFTPDPRLRDREDGTELFVTAKVQPAVLGFWQEQLNNCRAGLAI